MTEKPKVPPDEEVPEEEKKIEIPERWKQADVDGLVERGFRYYIKTKPNGARYMTMRLGNQTRSIGPYTPEKQQLLFEMFPDLKLPSTHGTYTDRRLGKRAKKPFFSIPIKRVAVIPRDYKPNIDVIQYFYLYKKNGFPGDFSDFINGNMMDHFVECNHIFLPVMIEEEIQTVETS